MKEPWWNSKVWVGVVTALITTVPVTTTAVHGWIKSNSEMQLAKAQHEHAVHSFYFKLAVDSQTGPNLRERVLRFLARKDPPETRLRLWAADELERVSQTLAIQHELEQKSQELEQKERKLESVIESADASKEQLQQLNKDRENLQQQVERLVGEIKLREDFGPPSSTAERVSTSLQEHNALRLANECFRQLKGGDLEAARISCEEAERLARVPRRRGAIFFNMGRIAEEEGDKEKACEFYTRSLAIRPNNSITIQRRDRVCAIK
jgi:tetratricopeptide (TPR) repeat protein